MKIFRFTFFLLVLLILPKATYSQNLQVDSLISALEQTSNAVEKSDLYYALSQELYSIDWDKSFEYSKEGLNISRKSDYKKGIIKNGLMFANLLIDSDSIKQVISLLDELMSIERVHWTATELNMYYLNYGFAYELTGNFTEGIKILLSGVDIAKEEGDTLGMAMLLNNISILYFNSESIKESIKTQRKALTLFLKVGHQNYITNSYINLGSSFSKLKEYDSLFYYTGIALKRLLKTEDSYGLMKCYANIADGYRALNQKDSTIYYYNKVFVILNETKKGEHPMFTNTEVGMLESLAEAYFSFNQTDSAFKYVNRAIAVAETSGYIEGFETLYLTASNIYAAKGKPVEALQFYKKYHQLYDDNYKEENEKNVANLLLNHELELERKNHEIALKEEKDSKALMVVLFGFSIGILVVIISLISQRLKNQRQKIENEKLRRTSAELKSDKLKLELNSKRKELATKMMYLLKKNEFIFSISGRLKELNKELSKANKKDMFQILHDLESMSNDQAWEEFELRFQEVHKDYYNHLGQAFPDLTPNELKLCAFLKLNLSTKEISSITFQSTESIKTARYRLRKKLNMDRETNLTSFLNTF
jgi:tetratricopeptide (TPR) repeat protein